MKINVTGNEELPKIVCVHPMLGSSGGVLDILKDLKGEYCIIAPDMSAHGSDTEDFISAKEEAKTVIIDGYRHCEYPFKNPETYTKMLEELMTK